MIRIRKPQPWPPTMVFPLRADLARNTKRLRLQVVLPFWRASEAGAAPLDSLETLAAVDHNGVPSTDNGPGNAKPDKVSAGGST